MAREFRLPDLGSGLQEGEIVRWCVAVGDTVASEAALCEIETEKSVIEIPVPYDGRVASLACAEGERVKVGDVLAVFETGSEAATPQQTTDVAASAAQSTGIAAHSTGARQATATPAQLGGASPAALGGQSKVASDPAPAGTAASVTPSATSAETSASTSARPRAMPSIRRIARERGVDLKLIAGTGKRGRITRADVEAAANSETVTSSAGRRERFSMLRATIARNMARSWREIPHVFSCIEIDASRLLEARKALGEELGQKVPLEAFLIRACLPALKRHPVFNAAVDGDGIVYHDGFHIGSAVDTPDGLVVPVLRDVDTLGWRDLVARLSDLQARAAARKASPAELSGPTFTVNNIGALGRIMGTSIIQSGTTAILSVGRATQKPVVSNGQIAIAPMMEVSLAFDHRAIDGGMAGRFLEDVAARLEHPARGLAD